MFVLTMRSSKKKLLIMPVVILMILIFIFAKNTSHDYAICSIGKYNLKASNNEERIKFLAQFGWDVSSEPIEMGNIKIPNTFNEVYKSYNSIQEEQGLNLADHTGETCQRFTYKILNYPKCSGNVYADILILNNIVVGGDVCSEELGGFMHSFINPSAVS